MFTPEITFFVGKTIPAEKFAIVHSEKYFAQNETLLLPALVCVRVHFLHCLQPLPSQYFIQCFIRTLSQCLFKEFMYIWNIFVTLESSPHLLNNVLEKIERSLVEHKQDKSKVLIFADVAKRLIH